MATKKINTDLQLTAKLLDGSGSAGTSGQILSSTGTATDWVSLSDISGVDGTGTANTIAMWSDADTITNAPITVSGNNTTFAGDLTLDDNSGASPSLYLKNGNNNFWRLFCGSSEDLTFRLGTVTKLEIDSSGNASFAGNVTLNSRLTFDYSGDHYFEAGTDSLSYKSSGGTSVMTLNASTQAATFAGDVTVTGDLIVSGSETILNTETVQVEDNIIQLNRTPGSPDTATAATSGITIYRGNGVTEASLIFDDADDTWDLTNNLAVAGDVTVNGSHLTLANGTTAAQSTDYLYIGGSNLGSADAAIYIGNEGDGSGYGYRIYYSGTGSGNNNKLIFKSENLGTNVDMLSFTADGNASFAGDLTIGDQTYASSTQAFSNFDQLVFDNSFSDTNRGPNKIVMHDNGGSWIGGFGVHSDTVSYYTGGEHKFYKTTSQTASSLLLAVNSSGATLEGDLTINGGDIILFGTGRIQGIDTVSAGTDAVNKTYVDTNFASSSHNHDSDYVNVTGDTMTGDLNMGGNSISDAVIGFVNMGPTQGASPDYNYIYYRITDDLTFDKNRIYELLIDADDNGGYSAIYHIYISQHNNSGNHDRVRFHYISGDKDRAELLVATDEHVWVRATAKWGNVKIRAIHENEDVSSMPFATTETRPTTQANGTSDFQWNGDNNTFTDQEQWHAGNDGAGSGLDADLLDGQEGSYYATASHNHDSDYVNVTGDTMTGALTISTNSPALILNDGDSTNTTNQTGYISLRNQGSETGWFGFGSSSNSDLTVKNNSGKVVLNGSSGVNIPNGNVGIGTTDPSDGDLNINNPRLHVLNTGSAGTYNLVARFQAGPDSDNTGAAIAINHSNDRGLLIKAGRKDSDRPAAYFDLIDSSGSTTNLLTMGEYDSNFNVGIGTTSPSAKLHVHSTSGDGLIRVTGDNIINSGGAIKGFNNGLAFNVAPSGGGSEIEAIRIKGDGNVGIGTPSPSYKLSIESSAADQLKISRTGVGFWNFNTYASGDLVIDNGSEHMRITSNGRVGIGETNPQNPLSVYHATFNKIATFISGDNNGLIQISDDDTNSYVGSEGSLTYIGQTAAASSNNLIINSSGKVGIGETNPARALTVKHSTQQGVARFVSGSTTMAFIDLKDANTTADNKVRFGAVGDELSLWANGERMRIDSSGNVGINETNPAFKLDVNGSVAITEYLYHKGDSNTYLRFSGDMVQLVAGGVEMIRIVEDTQDEVVINENSADVDFRVESDTDTHALFLEGSSGNVGIGTSSPGSELEVDGEITTTTITYPEPGVVDSSAYNGEIVYFGSQISMSEGKLMVLSTSAAGATWYQARDSSISLATGMLGIALGTTASAGVLVRGIAKNSAWSSFTEGQKLYLSPTNGAISNSITSDTNDFVRIVGYALGGNKIYFCPDNTYIQNS